MSGTSLDGLDICHCTFERTISGWTYEILHAETIPYPEEWQCRLAGAGNETALGLSLTDSGYGFLIGKLVSEFISRHGLKADFIASHGHTVFHQPSRGMTLQIGKGSVISAVTGLPVVCDFRSKDVALGGQGAPLVPVGDKLLFGGFDYCLNLGGFANISYDDRDRRIAFDICPVNILLNRFAREAGMPFDRDGNLARSGSLHPDLLGRLNAIPWYNDPPPKSLSKEWIDENILPILEKYPTIVSDRLNTFVEHAAILIAKAAGTDPGKKILITGGGAWNRFLIERISWYTKPVITIPDPMTVNFKEALIFAFLGLLRWEGLPNCLGSVTGAEKDNIGGAIYL